MAAVSSSSLLRRLRPGLPVAVALSTAVLVTALSAAPPADAGTAYPAAAPAPGGSATPVADPTGTVTPTSTPKPPDPPSTTPFPPSAPTNLTATQVRSTSVTLTWTAATRGCCPVVGYDIVYLSPFDDVVYSLSLGDVTTATVTNYIQPGRQYTFRVSARDGDNRRSPASDPLTVVTPVTDTGPDTTPPSAPGNLTVGEVTDSTARLSWSPSTDDVGVLAYDVYRFDGWFTSTRVATVPGTTYTMSLPAPTPLRTLYYVRARDAAGNVSIASNTVTVPTTPTPPPPSTCRVTYRNQSEWPGGFVTAVTVQNTGTAPVDGWTLTFGFPGDQQVTTAWNATVSQTGAAVTARNADWNRLIAPNGSATFGFQGRWSASDAPPTAFSLNGAPCAVG